MFAIFDDICSDDFAARLFQHPLSDPHGLGPKERQQIFSFMYLDREPISNRIRHRYWALKRVLSVVRYLERQFVGICVNSERDVFCFRKRRLLFLQDRNYGT